MSINRDDHKQMNTPENVAVDVWLYFEEETDEEPTYEANTYVTEHGTYRVDWYHTAVGHVRSREFDTLADAYDWLEAEGFENYTS